MCGAGSSGPCRVAEIPEAGDQGRVVLGRGRALADQPVPQIGVVLFDQAFIGIELRRGEPGEVGIGEGAQQQIRLLGAAMPGAEQQPLAADLVRLGHARKLSVGAGGQT